MVATAAPVTASRTSVTSTITSPSGAVSTQAEEKWLFRLGSNNPPGTSPPESGTGPPSMALHAGSGATTEPSRSPAHHRGGLREPRVQLRRRGLAPRAGKEGALALTNRSRLLLGAPLALAISATATRELVGR